MSHVSCNKRLDEASTPPLRSHDQQAQESSREIGRRRETRSRRFALKSPTPRTPCGHQVSPAPWPKQFRHKSIEYSLIHPSNKYSLSLFVVPSPPADAETEFVTGLPFSRRREPIIKSQVNRGQRSVMSEVSAPSRLTVSEYLFRQGSWGRLP